MGQIRNRVLESAPLFSGQKSGIPPKTLKPTDCEVVSNMLLDNGMLKKVNGQSLYATLPADTTARVRWVDQYKYRFIAQRDNYVYLESAEGSGSFATVASDFNSARMFGRNHRGSIYMVNGVDSRFYTESNPVSAITLNLRQLGVYPATSYLSGSITSIISGGLLGSGTYQYVITLYDPITNTESPACGARSGELGLFNSLNPVTAATLDYFAPVSLSVATGGASKKISISFAGMTAVIGSSAPAATERRTHFIVYRTEVGGTVFKRVEIPRSIATFVTAGLAYVDNTADTALGDILQTETSPPPLKSEMQTTFTYLNSVAASPQTTPPDAAYSGYTHFTFFNDTLFAVGAKNPGIFTKSELSQFQPFDSVLYIHDPFVPDSVLDTREVGPGDGQVATAVAVMRDSVVILLKERSIYYVSGTSVDNYTVRVMDSRRGCVHAGTVQETPYGVFALDRVGIIQVGQIGPAEVISNEIKDAIAGINFAAISTAYSGYDSQRHLYYLSVPTDGSLRPNKTFVYDAQNPGWTTISGGEGTSMFIGSASDDSQIEVLGSYTNGRIIDFSDETVVTNLGGTRIDSEYLSGPFYGGDATRKKKAKFVYITAESNTDWTIDLEIVSDFGQSPTFSLPAINSNSVYAIWASSLLDSGVNVGVFDSSLFAAGKVRKQLKIPLSCIGNALQVRIVNKSTDGDQYGFKILAVELESVMLGR